MAESKILQHAEVDDSGWIYPLSGDTTVKYRKRLGVVYVQFSNYHVPASRSGTAIFYLPEGFRPSENFNFVMREHTTGSDLANAWIGYGTGAVNIANTVTDVGVSSTAVYPIG